MTLLRDQTAEAHAAAEREPFMRSLLRGEVSRAGYVAYLEQMLVVHRALESALAACPDAKVRRVVRGEQFQGPNLAADLRALGGRETPEPMAPAAALAERLRALTDPSALLGALYVLEGSKNGAVYLARAVRRALGLSAGMGDRYLDPHGPAQKDVWATFKGRMNAEPWDETQRASMVASARAVFEGMQAIAEALHDAHGVPADGVALPIRSGGVPQS